MLALRSEELRPGHHLGVLLKERAALAFGHAAPHTEFDAVVQRVSAALQHYRTMSADHCSFALRGPPDEQLVGISRTA